MGVVGLRVRKQSAACDRAALGAPLGWSLPKAFPAAAVQEADGASACVTVSVSLFLAREQETAAGRRRDWAAGPPTWGQDPSAAWLQACLLQDKAGGKGKGSGKG